MKEKCKIAYHTLKQKYGNLIVAVFYVCVFLIVLRVLLIWMVNN